MTIPIAAITKTISKRNNVLFIYIFLSNKIKIVIQNKWDL